MKILILYSLIIPFFIFDGVYILLRSVKAVRAMMLISEIEGAEGLLWPLVSFLIGGLILTLGILIALRLFILPT